MIEIGLPFPSKALSPNARGHWAPRHLAGSKAKRDAYFLTSPHNGRFADAKAITVYMRFEPPGRYRYDRDNLVARMKAALDGIAAGLGVDDNIFRPQAPEMGEPHRPQGRVIVRLEAAE